MSEKEKAIEELKELGKNLTPVEKQVFMHRYAATLKFGTVNRANELISKIGFEEAARLSTDEFLKKVEAETPKPPIEPQKLEFSSDV